MLPRRFAARYALGNTQVVVPSINFTCRGSILSWIVGGQWQGNTDSFTELQIWRGSEDGGYTIVGSTLINVTQGTPGELQLYHYPLTTPLSFEAGDVPFCKSLEISV